MSKIIDSAQIHPLQYPNQGQNYVFNGCMKFLMECVGEKNNEYDYWFFTAVSGDSFVQVFNTDKSKWSTCFSQSKFDYELIKRVFDSIGYNFFYLEPNEWRKDISATKSRIKESIDKGVPILAKGFQSDVKGVHLPTDEVSCIVGYDNDDFHFFRMTEETTDLISFSLEDPLPYIFVFIGDKKNEVDVPRIESVYRNVLKNVPILMNSKPSENNNGCYFGINAFEKWAESLEGDFYLIKKEEFEAVDSIASWRYYCVYVCIISTNIFAKKKTIDRAIELNPDLKELAPLIDCEYEKLSKLEKELEDASGSFNVTYEVLQNTEKRREIALILRKFPTVMNNICKILQKL